MKRGKCVDRWTGQAAITGDAGHGKVSAWGHQECPMCDYSLHNVRTRPVKVGDKPATRLFSSGTRGFCAPEDANVADVCPARD